MITFIVENEPQLVINTLWKEITEQTTPYHYIPVRVVMWRDDREKTQDKVEWILNFVNKNQTLKPAFYQTCKQHVTVCKV